MFWKKTVFLMVELAILSILIFMFASRASASEEPGTESVDSLTDLADIQTQDIEPETDGQIATVLPDVANKSETVPSSVEAIAERLYFSIDDSECYSGMKKSYKQGYVPTRSGKKVKIVLPLTATGKTRNGKIQIRPDLGEISTCPFVYRNYQKTIKLKKATAASGRKKSIYLVKLTLALKDGWTPGTYPVVLRLHATDRNGEAIDQDFTVYVTLAKTAKEQKAKEKAARAATAAADSSGGGSDYEGDDGGYGEDGGNYDTGGGRTTEETKPVSQPVVLVTEYHTDPGTLMAGDSLSLSFTLKNNSQKKAVQNLTIGFSCPETGLLVELPGETLFADRLGKEEERSFSIPCRLETSVPEGILSINLQLTYDNEDAQTLSSSGVLRFPVSQTVCAELTPPLLPAAVRTGNTEKVEVQVSNIGRGQIRNARLSLDAPGLTLSGNTFLGELEGGTSQTVELKFFVRTLKQNSDGSENTGIDEKYGDTTGTLTLTYEDGAGKEYSESTAVFTRIQPMEVPKTKTLVLSEKTEKDIRQWQISVALAVGVLLSLVFSLLAAAWKRIRRT